MGLSFLKIMKYNKDPFTIEDLEAIDADENSQEAKENKPVMITGPLSVVLAIVIAIAAGYQFYITPFSVLISESSFWVKILILYLSLVVTVLEYHFLQVRRQIRRTSYLEKYEQLREKTSGK
jgi:cobalamin biosynthesis protein CobD/CbiB